MPGFSSTGICGLSCGSTCGSIPSTSWASFAQPSPHPRHTLFNTLFTCCVLSHRDHRDRRAPRSSPGPLSRLALLFFAVFFPRAPPRSSLPRIPSSRAPLAPSFSPISSSAVMRPVHDGLHASDASSSAPCSSSQREALESGVGESWPRRIHAVAFGGMCEGTRSGWRLSSLSGPLRGSWRGVLRDVHVWCERNHLSCGSLVWAPSSAQDTHDVPTLVTLPA